MNILDYLPSVVVLRTEAPVDESLAQGVKRAGALLTTLFLDRSDWKTALTQIWSDCSGWGVRGLLLVADFASFTRTFSHGQDALIEQLESGRWDLLYVGYEGHAERQDQRVVPFLQHCDLPPSSISAIALRGNMLDEFLDFMPDRCVDSGWRVPDWLTAAAWMTQACDKSEATYAVWPPLLTCATIQGARA